MTTAVQPTSQARHDARTVVRGGVRLGLLTVVGVVVFALLSRVLDGTVETVIQSLLVLVGGTVFAYLPAATVRPRDVDTIAWAALVGLLGALVFAVLDTAVLRPLNLYHWTWDAIGGGSGFWYIPVWWMGAATLAWLGSWVYSLVGRSGSVNIGSTAALTVALALVLFLLLTVTSIAPFHAAVAALAFVLALVVHVLLAMTQHRK